MKEIWFTGKVIKGLQNGRKINFPTANIQPDFPVDIACGVYAAKACLAEKNYNGMLYVGTRPTFHLTQTTIELHLFDFSKDIYGENLEIHLLSKIRNEMRFDNTEQLAQQIAQDEWLIRNQFLIKKEPL